MKRIIPIITAITILTACGHEPKDHIGDDFRPYVNEFATLYAKPLPTMQIIFSPNTTAGQSNIYGDGSLEIIINKSWWDAACPDERRAIVFHEMAHIVLKRGHSTGMTYMTAEMQSCEFYKKNRIQLDYEMFNRSSFTKSL